MRWAGSAHPAERAGRVRVLRIITRMNIGGPALHAALLTARLNPSRYESRLITGLTTDGEGNYLAHQGIELDAVQLVPTLVRQLAPARDLIACVQLYRALRQFRPDIVHTHMAKAGALGRLAAWLARVPIIVHTYHGHVLRGYFPPGKERWFIHVERGLARLTTTLIAVSESVRAELLALRIGRPEQYAVIPLGVEVEPYLRCEALRGTLRRELGLDDSHPLIGIVARLVPIKRHEDFLHAARQVVAQIPQARFLLVGDGEARTTLERLVREQGLASHVRFLGWRRDLDRIYADCDVVTLTSGNEGSPVSLIEAMAAGRAVVATGVGGIPDLVEHEVTGLLVPPADPSALAEALLTMIRDPGRRQRMGQQARERVRVAYRAERLLQDIDQLYQELFTRRRQRQGA